MADKPEQDLQKFTVIAHAITLRTGKARSAVRRFARGAVLELDANEQRVKDLLQSKSISAKATPSRFPTLQQAVKGYGALDDPVKAPSATDAPATDTTPATPGDATVQS